MPCACAGLRRPLPTNALLTQSQAQIKCREQRRKVKSLRNVTDRTNYENDAVNKTLEKGEPDLSSRFDCTMLSTLNNYLGMLAPTLLITLEIRGAP